MLSTILSGMFYAIRWQPKSDTYNYETVLEQHQLIFDSVRAGDADAAEHAMLEHIKKAWTFINDDLENRSR